MGDWWVTLEDLRVTQGFLVGDHVAGIDCLSCDWELLPVR